MNQTETITQQQRIQKRMERLYLSEVYKGLQKQVLSFTANLKEYGEQFAVSRLTTTILNDQIGGVIKKIYLHAALVNANVVYGKLQRYEPKKKFVGFGFNEKWTADVTRYFQQYLLDKAVLPISETTKAFILKLLEKATNEGWSIEQTVKQLENSDITRNRARMIVRTETVRATNFGGMLGAYESNLVMEKRWISAHDVRTRGAQAKDEYSHMALHGTQIDLLKPFVESRRKEEIMFPGDPEASAGNVINCRCTLGFLPKRDENGRLIRKPAQQQERQRMGASLVDMLGGLLVGFSIGNEIFTD